MTGLIARLKEANVPYRENIQGSTISTFRIGGCCRLVIEPSCMEELMLAAKFCREANTNFYVIGNGSNLLFSDKGCPEPLIRTVHLTGMIPVAGGLRVLCGTPIQALLHRAAKAGSDDLLFAAGIPGTVGGGLFMNAGTEGKGLLNFVDHVEVLDRETHEIKTVIREKCDIFYRKSKFQENRDLILAAKFVLHTGKDPAEIAKKIREKQKARKSSQPTDLPSAGSVWKRPAPDVPLSKFFDDWGFRGRRIGNAAISEKHAGFVVNLGGATAADVIKLLKEMQTITERNLGFCPEREIRLIPDRNEFFTDD